MAATSIRRNARKSWPTLDKTQVRSSGAAGLAAYPELRPRVRRAIAQGKERAVQAVEREKVRTSWEVGKLILEHILLNKKRGAYGESVTRRLSKDLGVSARELRYMVEFARTYPKLPSTADLPWGHYRDLLSINDAEKREALAKRAAEGDWSQDELRSEIRKLGGGRRTVIAGTRQSTPAGTKQSPAVVPGKVGTYRIAQINGKPYYDLGFYVFTEIKGRVPKPKEPAPEDLYTYRAVVESVYDGDTFHAWIDLGFGNVLYQRLRLRRIDAPELMSADGEAAKKALASVIARNPSAPVIARSPKGATKQSASSILIKTSKTDDQYGRYLVDVWVDGANIIPKLLASGLFTIRGDA